jgi:8-amino-7-oxononanoate synthase
MSSLPEDLNARLATLRSEGLYRELRRIDSPPGPRLQHAGRELLNFSGNDYLGLAQHPALIAATARGAQDWGAGATASRLVCGSLGAHHELEETIAEWKGVPACLSFSSGYSAALGVIPALVGRGDLVVVDRLVHACCLDAARLSGAQLRVYPHNDLDTLDQVLRRARRDGRSSARRVLVVTESIFSMEGDRAPLRELVELKDRHGAWLMLDEAHATGVVGPTGAGCAELDGLTQRIEVQMGTLGKALGCAGGYLTGDRVLIEYLVNRARSFIFSTAPPPAVAVAATESIGLVRGPEGIRRRALLWERIQTLASALHRTAGKDLAPASAILPWLVGPEALAIQYADRLRQAGCYVPAIRFPTVARGAARLRFTVSAAHSATDLAHLGTALRSLGEPP